MTVKTRKILRLSLLTIQILLLIPIGWFLLHVFMPRGFASKTSEFLSLQLSSGPFKTGYYPTSSARGVLIVATGDGGWSNQWEEPVAIHSSEVGYAVGTFDCRRFADTRKFNHAQLVEAFNACVAAVRQRAKLPADCPVWYTGWSTGAEWAVAAAASLDREKHLEGVLCAAPGGRSRYGISQSDLLGLDPSGPDTYALADLTPALHGVRVVVFTGELDPLDDTQWIQSMDAATPHKIVEIPGVPHDMDGAGPRFLTEFDTAIQWMMDHPLL